MTIPQNSVKLYAGLFILPVLLILVSATDLQAQYFGRNKVSYRNFDFKVVESPHFQFYHYFNNDSSVNNLVRLSEKWYQMHQELLQDTIKFKNPIIFYQNHADFQQTTAISGAIGVGTGGVTEGLKNRVVMPAFESNAQTDHVLGHELVHAFQYNLLRDSDDESLSLSNMRNLPLCMVEGMAEYMSLGRVDAHTAMWMRDAYLNKDIPSIKDLNTNPKYFPYRYGQAFWAFVTGVWGDDAVLPLYLNTARYGLEQATDSVLNVSTETLSAMWKNSIQLHYDKLLADSTISENLVGKKILSEETAGEMNISPAISPDGKYVMFLSELGIFTIDLFLADANTGKVIRKVSSTARNSHIDAFSFVESAGAWAPDSRQFGFVAFSKGQNKLIIVDAEKGKEIAEHFIPGIPAFSNPTWSPDGRSVVVTGLVNGQSDLYQYNLDDKKVTQLTNDPYSDLQPQFSPDGKSILFSSDRLAFEAGGFSGRYTLNLTVLNLEDRKLKVLDFFRGANNLNPVFAPDAQSVYFLSNRDGYRNLYSYNLENERISQLTHYFTGISGITEYSPAVSVSKSTGEVVYSYFFGGDYTVYKAAGKEFKPSQVAADAVDLTAATLPPFSPVGPVIVSNNLAMPQRFGYTPQEKIEEQPYRPQFKLDYIGNTGVGLSTSPFGTGIAGGVAGIFSDILGNNQLFGVLSVNGEIYDFGGQFAYINQKRRLHWGAAVSHVPYRTGFVNYELNAPRLDNNADSVRDENGDVIIDNFKQQINLYRIFEEKISAFTYLPISSTRRFEFGGSLAFYSYRLELINNYYRSYGGPLVWQSKFKGEAPDGFAIQQLNAAYVGDNSFSGVVGPLLGHRFRLGAETYFGEVQYHSLTADFRRYFFFKPFSLALRAMHYGRYGKDAESFNLVGPLFLGWPGMVHGYDDMVLDQEAGNLNNSISINDLAGSRIAVANVELRLPFTGPKQLALMKSNILFTELALFFDSGLAWDSSFESINPNRGSSFTEEQGQQPSQGLQRFGSQNIPQRIPIFSAGLGLRINLFGQLVIEPYLAKAFQRAEKGLQFGVNFVPAW